VIGLESEGCIYVYVYNRVFVQYGRKM